VPRLPSRFAAVIRTFAPLFLQQPTFWRHVKLPLAGAIPAPGKHTVTSPLRIARLGREQRFTTTTACLTAPLGALGQASASCSTCCSTPSPTGTVVPGIDDT
jgi:hypothetical protein